ncbi:MAG: hypothetical protein KDB53_11560 [Planctomycetes bacterium]|nr:hypothetical protein [Planctomycetota bacterium]
MFRCLTPMLCLAALFVLAPGTADATIVIKKDLTKLAAEADQIVHGRIVSQRVDWAPGTNLIFTYSTLRVASTIKGAAAKTIEIAELGGTIGELTQFASGMPRYALGQRVFAFLKRDVAGQWRTHGLDQGRFDLVTNLATEETLVKLDPIKAHVYATEIPVAERSAGGTLSLDDFVDLVSGLVAKAKKEKEEQR